MAAEGPTALIGAYEPGPGPGGLRALQPLAGMSLVEHQARRAIEAGAARILLLVDETPPELIEAIARLRHDNIEAGLARGIDEAADALSQDGSVLLLAESCLPDVAVLRAVASALVPTLATLPDIPEFERFERIDAEQRWAGVALLDGHRIAETAAMIGAWDPVSTMLRRAVQEDAARIAAAAPSILATDAAALGVAERAILADARRPADDLIGRLLFAPAEDLALPILLARKADPNIVAGLAAGLALVGGMIGMVGMGGWLWPAFAALLLSGPAAAGAARLSRIRQGSPLWQRVCGLVRRVGAVIGVASLVRFLAIGSAQWGWCVVGLALVASLLSLWNERKRHTRSPIWLASADTLLWAMLPFALLGRWGGGLLVATLYAAGSFAWLHWRPQTDNDGAP